MVTIWFFPIGILNGAPVSFPIDCPNLDTARMVYDALIASGAVPATERP